MVKTTPVLLGDKYLDGFLWGKAYFPSTKTTTRSYINITYHPTDIVIDLMDKLERYANIELNHNRTNDDNHFSEVIDIYFRSAIKSPGSLKCRELKCYWDEEFLKGVIYSRLYIPYNSNQIFITKTSWMEIISDICSTYKIPHSKHTNKVFILSEGYHHPFFKKWIKAFENDRKRDKDLIDSDEFEELSISRDTGFYKSHYDIRMGFNGNNKEIFNSIRGTFEGRMFWFRNEILSLINHPDKEIKIEARLTLLHIGTRKDILYLNELQRKKNIEEIDNFDNKIYGSEGSFKFKRIKNARRNYEILLEKSIDDYNCSPFEDLTIFFANWLKRDQQERMNIYFDTIDEFLEGKSSELKFIIDRISEMKHDTDLIKYQDLLDEILIIYSNND